MIIVENLVSLISFIILDCNNINKIYKNELNNTKLKIINNIKHYKKIPKS